jgi:hypothetical protein
MKWGTIITVAAFLPGCGLVSRDVSKVPFDLPPKSYSFDTSSTGWKLPAGSFPQIPCGPAEVITDCCNPPDPLPKPNCSVTPLSCEEGLCTLRFQVSAVQQMALKQEVPVLANIDRQYLLDVYISQIRYTVMSTLNVGLPSVDLYVAPDGVTSASDPQAEKFGTVPLTPAMANGDGLVDLSPDSEQIFATYAHELATPFNFIATTTIVIPSGSPIPSGRVDITVTGQLTASL